jgi:hypothetical protein
LERGGHGLGLHSLFRGRDYPKNRRPAKQQTPSRSRGFRDDLRVPFKPDADIVERLWFASCRKEKFADEGLRKIGSPSVTRIAACSSIGRVRGRWAIEGKADLDILYMDIDT